MDILFLADFSPIRPSFGLLFWTTLIFVLFWIIMAKYGFGPIKDALKKREGDIQNALDEAKKAKEEMKALNARNEEILKEAQAERSKIIKEAKAAKDMIVNEAKTKAKEEAQRIALTATQEIEAAKKAALTEVKNEVGQMALGIAEKVIRKELQNNPDQVSFVNKLVDEIKLN